MRLMLTFYRAYPRQSLIIILALLLGGLAEGVGLTGLLPLLSIAIGNTTSAAEASGLEAIVVDVLARVGLEPSLGVLLLVIILGLTLKGVMLLLANRQVGYTVARIATRLRLDLLDALMATRWAYCLRQPAGIFANTIATEANRASQAFHMGANVLALIIQTVVYLCLALAVSWQFSLIALALGTGCMLLFYGLIRMARRAGVKQTKLLRLLIARLTDSIYSIKPLKAMGRLNITDTLLRQHTKRLNRVLRKQVLSKEGLKALQEPVVAVLIAGAIFLAVRAWGMALPTVMVLVFLLARVILHLTKIQRRYQQMVIQESAYWAIRGTIDEALAQREPDWGQAAATLEQGIYLEDVYFAYERHEVLQGLSLEIPAGEITVLIGPSGAGKTTVLDLVTGLFPPRAGTVYVDKNPLETLDRLSWRRTIGYVPQQTVLLHDTIFNNVTLGDPDLTTTDAEEALRVAGAWSFVAAMPEGMDTMVGEQGSMLSGGQRQRISLARALAHRPRLLILDEATSALDPETEMEICDTLRGLRNSLTILAVSHQSALATVADRVYRVENGTASRVPDAPEAAMGTR